MPRNHAGSQKINASNPRDVLQPQMPLDCFEHDFEHVLRSELLLPPAALLVATDVLLLQITPEALQQA